MARSPRIVLAAGGTGGHLFPAEALAAELVKSGIEVHLATDRRGMAYGGAFPALERHEIRAATEARRSADAGRVPALAQAPQPQAGHESTACRGRSDRSSTYFAFSFQ